MNCPYDSRNEILRYGGLTYIYVRVLGDLVTVNSVDNLCHTFNRHYNIFSA